MPTRLFLLLSPLFFFAQTAEGATGIVVRLITGGETVESPVVATLTNADGTTHTATLLDNGEPPDVNPGDHHYSGSTMLEGENFTVSLSLGDATEEVGEVSWPTDVTARDLIITRYEGIVTLETGAGSNDMPAGQPTASGDAGPSPGPEGVAAPAEGGTMARAPAVTFPDDATAADPSEDATLYVIGGVLLLILAGVAFLWFRPQDETEPSPARFTGSDQAHRMPEPGLLGEGTPSMSDGACVWHIDAEDTDEFIGLLLGSMAAHHRVLVVSPGAAPLPLVAGGPVFKMKNPRPSHVSQTLESLSRAPGLNFSIFIRATEMNAQTISEYCETLPQDVGTAIIVNAEHTGPESSVRVSREADGWSIVSGSTTVRLTMNSWGMSTAVTGTAEV